jgi:tetratricopeptide (TPR) repeat protein
MRLVRNASLILLAAVGVMAIGACGSSGSDVDPVREAEWASLVEAKGDLDGLREEREQLRDALSAARAMAEEEDEGEAEAGDESGGDAEEPMTVEEIEAKLATMEDEIVGKADSFMQTLVAYLNADPMIEGEAPTERQIAALRMKSSEDMVLAQEYIEKGGDYQRAISIYQNALTFDPENEELKAALEAAMSERYMSEERFAQAKKGMTQDEIREVLGQVNLYNVRDYEDRDVTAWFYPTAEGGFAAAVWFRENKKSGELEAYQLKYDAVSPETQEQDS